MRKKVFVLLLIPTTIACVYYLNMNIQDYVANFTQSGSNVVPEKEQNLSNTDRVTHNIRATQRPGNQSKIINVQPTSSSLIPNQYIIYTCGSGGLCGGLGDRQKGIVAAYLIANITRKQLKIEISTPCSIWTALKARSDKFVVHNNEFSGRKTSRLFLIDGGGFSLRHEALKSDIRPKFNSEVVYFRTNVDFVSYLNSSEVYKHELRWMKNMKWHQVYKYVLEEIFTLSDSLQQRLNSFLAHKQDKKLVCAQIRIGRNPSNTNDPAIADINNLDGLWEFFRKYNDPSKYRFFITTDAQKVRDEGKKRFPEVMLDSEGPIVHVERTHSGNVCDGQKKGILDQYILGRCDILVISGSGFGRIGAFFRDLNKDFYLFGGGKILPAELDGGMIKAGGW